jgi:hypothetical protein
VTTQTFSKHDNSSAGLAARAKVHTFGAYLWKGVVAEIFRQA